MISYVGYGNRDLESEPVPYVRRHPELLILLRGQCGLVKEGHRIQMGSDSAWLMPAGSCHAWQGDGTSCRLLSVMNDDFAHFLAVDGGSEDGLYRMTTAQNRHHFSELGARLHHARNDFSKLCHLSHIVLGEVGLLFEVGESAAPQVDWRVDYALSWFDEHMATGPTAEQIAGAVGCSSAHLRRLFKLAGLAPISKHLDERRLERATTMLRSGQWNTDYIARQCGWRSAGALTHAMRRGYGCSVRDWLKQRHQGMEQKP